MPQPDVLTTNHGTIWTFYPATARAQDWITYFLNGETAAEHRFGEGILRAMISDGLVLQDTTTGRTARSEAN